MASIIKWLSSTICDFCRVDCATQLWFVDGKTRRGPWALMCPTCWKQHGIGRLGLGFGQKYEGITRLKIEG